MATVYILVRLPAGDRWWQLLEPFQLFTCGEQLPTVNLHANILPITVFVLRGFALRYNAGLDISILSAYKSIAPHVRLDEEYSASHGWRGTPNGEAQCRSLCQPSGIIPLYTECPLHLNCKSTRLILAISQSCTSIRPTECNQSRPTSASAPSALRGLTCRSSGLTHHYSFCPTPYSPRAPPT